jgi:hypothetical protein
MVSLWDKSLISAVISLEVSSGFGFSIVSNATTPAWRMLCIYPFGLESRVVLGYEFDQLWGVGAGLLDEQVTS